MDDSDVALHGVHAALVADDLPWVALRQTNHSQPGATSDGLCGMTSARQSRPGAASDGLRGTTSARHSRPGGTSSV